MAVQVWIGEKPEHPNERRAIVALANGLERLDGLYLILANFSVGGRAIDLVILKEDAIFVIELKHCDGKIFGGVNGSWFIESANGVRKRLNPGRRNPYNQVISYYYSLINFLNEHRSDFLSPNRASSIDFRTCRRVVVIAPTLQEGSSVEIDWKVDLKGLDELPTYLVTERSSEIELSEDEMLAIPRLLNLTRWREVNELIAGVLPNWDATPSDPAPHQVLPVAQPPEPPPTAPQPSEPAPSSAPAGLAERATALLRRWPGRVAATLASLALVLALVFVLRPTTQAFPAIDQPAPLLSTSQPGPGAGGVGPAAVVAAERCVWSGFQPVGRRQAAQPGTWENVGAIGAAPALSPDVIVTLEEVSFCDGQITMTWSLQNNLDNETITLPLTNENIAVRDELGHEYVVVDELSRPREVRAAPQSQERGTAVIDRPASLNAATIRITLKDEPFGEAIWLVPLRP